MSFTIDVHHHILPDFFWRETNDGAHPVGGITPPPWDEAGTLAFMDDARIDVAVTSISTPGVHVGDNARARHLARRCNELAAAMMQKAARSAIGDGAGQHDVLRHDCTGDPGRRITTRPIPAMVSSLLLVSLERCCTTIRFSIDPIEPPDAANTLACASTAGLLRSRQSSATL